MTLHMIILKNPLSRRILRYDGVDPLSPRPLGTSNSARLVTWTHIFLDFL